MRPSFFRNATLLGAAQGVNILLALVSRIVLSRSLGVASYGAFGAATNAISVTSRVFNFGSASAAQYFASRTAVPRSAVVGTSLSLAALVSLVGLVGQFVLIGPMQHMFFDKHPGGLQALLALSWCMPFIILAMNMGVMLIPLHRVREYGLIQVLSGVVFVSLCLGLLPFMGSLQAAVLAQCTVWGAGLVATLWFLRKELRGMQWNLGLARDLVSFGFKSWPNGCLSIGIASFAVLFGARFMSPHDLSVFVLAMNITEGLFAPHASLGSLVLSKQASEEDAAHPKVLQLIRVSLAMFAGLFGLLALVGWWAIPVVFGQAFRPAFVIALALFITGASHAMLKTMGNAFAGSGRPGLTTWALLGEIVALSGLLWLFGPMGLWGVVGASVAASVVGWGIALVQMRHLYATHLRDLLVVKRADWIPLQQRLKKAA